MTGIDVIDNAVLISEFLGLPKDKVVKDRGDGRLSSTMTMDLVYGIAYGIRTDLECVLGHGEFSTKSIVVEDDMEHSYYAFFPEEMRFHLSWDWLSLAIIRSREVWMSEIDLDGGTGMYYVEIFNNLDLMDLKATYEAVVAFIKHYNSINK